MSLKIPRIYRNYVTRLRNMRRVADMGVEEHKRLASVDVAAAYAGVHPKTIRRYIKQDKLTAYRVGVKFIRLDLNEVDDVFAPRAIPRAS